MSGDGHSRVESLETDSSSVLSHWTTSNKRQTTPDARRRQIRTPERRQTAVRFWQPARLSILLLHTTRLTTQDAHHRLVDPCALFRVRGYPVTGTRSITSTAQSRDSSLPHPPVTPSRATQRLAQCSREHRRPWPARHHRLQPRDIQPPAVPLLASLVQTQPSPARVVSPPMSSASFCNTSTALSARRRCVRCSHSLLPPSTATCVVASLLCSPPSETITTAASRGRRRTRWPI